MKKISALLTAMAISGFAANAGTLPEGTPFSLWDETPVEGSFVTSASMVCFEWEDDLHFTKGEKIYFTLQRNEEEPVEYNNEGDNYCIILGSPYWWYGEESSNSVFFTFDKTSVAGEYTITIPAGILQNENGDTNPSQTLTFYIVGTLYENKAKILPAQSVDVYNEETNKTIPAPFYKASELNNVTLEWEGISLALSGTGTVVVNGSGKENEIENENVKVEDNNKLSLNLSNLSDGLWNVTIPAGFIKGEDTSGSTYINGEINLKYIIQNEATPFTEVTMTTPTSTYSTYFDIAQFNFGQPIMLKENAPEVTLTSGSSNFTLSPTIMVQSGKYELRLSSSVQIQTPGEYTLTVPAGLVTNGTYENSQITKTFHLFSYDTNYEVTPQNNTTVTTEDLAKIIITFPNATTISAITNNWRDIQLSVNDGSSINYNTLNLDSEVFVKGNSIEIQIPNIQEYSYTISIPSLDFQLSETTANYNIELYYKAWNGMADAIVLQGPGQRTTPNVEVELTWDYQTLNLGTDQNISLTSYGDPIPVPSDLIQLKNIVNPDNQNSATNKNNALYINLTPVLAEYMASQLSYKNFVLSIPAGFVTNETGQANPAKTISFAVYPVIPEEMEFEETETEGVYVFYWNYVSWMSPTLQGNLTLTGKDIEEIILKESSARDVEDLQTGEYMLDYIDTEYGEVKAFYVNLNYDLNGYYELNIPAGFIWVDLDYLNVTDVINEEINMQILIGTSKIENLSTTQNDGILRVYNLQGVNVMNATDSKSLNSLEPGIYIVNGKKVAIRK